MATKGRLFSFSSARAEAKPSKDKEEPAPISSRAPDFNMPPPSYNEPSFGRSGRSCEPTLGGGPSRSLEREGPLAWAEEFERNYQRLSSINFFHHSLEEPAQVSIVSTDGTNMHIKLEEERKDAVVFPGDPIQFAAATPDRVYMVNGKVTSIEPYDKFPEYKIEVTSVMPKENLRKFERFVVNKPGRISICDYDDGPVKKEAYALVRDASLGGFKIYCQEELDNDKVVYLTVFTDKNIGITTEITVIERIMPEGGFYYIYRVQIHSLADVDRDELVKFLDKCKVGDLGN